MSRTVHRFRLDVDAEHTDIGPRHGTGPVVGNVLWVKSREYGTVDIWVVVDPDLDATDPEATPPARRFTVTGTGRYLPDNAVHVGSSEDGANSRLVWHVFEVCAHDPQPAGDAPRWCRICWPEA